MHFGERDYSKNGHRTIMFKDHKTTQHRASLTQNDLRKIEVVYGPECRNRDRMEKMELCQSYPGVARRKRDIVDVTQNLRVNRDITPPPVNVDPVSESLKELGIEDAVQETVDQIYKISSLAFKNAKQKHCNITENVKLEDSEKDLDIDSNKKSLDINSNNTEDKVDINMDIDNKSLNYNNADIVKIVDVINNFAKGMVQTALKNLTEFCSSSGNVKYFQRACNWNSGNRCQQTYRSTKSGRVKFSTQHRPVYIQSTKHDGHGRPRPFVKIGRTDDEKTIEKSQGRKKRNADIAELPIDIKTTTEINISTSEVTSTTMGSVSKSRKLFSDNRRSLGIARSKASKSKVEIEKVSSESLEQRKPKKNKRRNKRKKQLNKDISEKKYLSGEKYRDVDKVKKRKLKKKDKLKTQVSNRLKLPKTVALSKANKEFYKERQWPGGIVPYVIKDLKDYDLEDMRSRLEEVNDVLKKKTCVRIQEITEKEAEGYEDFLLLDTSPDYVTGRVGGRQNFGSVELFKGGQHRQHAAMMVMAMLGFYFEVARHDRDKYIRVHMRHVRPDKLHHFEKIRPDGAFELPYDYKSATHPAWQFWRKVYKTGISTVATFKDKDPDGSVMKSLGQNEELLSELDIVKINCVYGVECFKIENKLV